MNASGARNFTPKRKKRAKKKGTGWSPETSVAYRRMKELGNEKFIKYNFAALVYRMDLGIKKIMQTLKESGVEEDTMIIFTCDNGSIMGSNYPLTGCKSSHFEGGVRVPMIFWSKSLADSKAKGRIVEELCPTTDIAPTLVGMATQKDQPAFPFDGINLWPYLKSNTPIPDDQVFYYSSGSIPLYKACGVYLEKMMGTLSKEVSKRASESFGSIGMSEGIFNAVYVKGKDKLVYWSTTDGSVQGAVHKELPTNARNTESPESFFKEEQVVGGKLPTSEAGQKLLQEFIDYTNVRGAGELMHEPVFDGTDTTNEKRAREYRPNYKTKTK